LCGNELREGEPQVRTRPTHRVIRTIRAGIRHRRRRLHFKATPAGNRQRLRDHRHVLGHTCH
jgi:hypothetical protein